MCVCVCMYALILQIEENGWGTWMLFLFCVKIPKGFSPGLVVLKEGREVNMCGVHALHPPMVHVGKRELGRL